MNISTRNKKKKRRLKKDTRKLKVENKKNIKRIIIYLVLGLFLLGSNFILKNYVSKNLLADDRETVIRAYFLVQDYTEDLNKAKNVEDERTAIEENLSIMSHKLASFATAVPSDLVSIEGQRLLNRYFKSISELGINTVNLSNQFYDNSELADEYLANIELVKQREKEVFTYFKLEESRIKEK